LPFFAYGLFRPGQLGFLRLKPHVARSQSTWEMSGSMLDRDRLPLYEPSGSGTVQGALISFRGGAQNEAYSAVTAIEPAKQYRWDEQEARFGDARQVANVLIARFPRKGTVPMDGEWDGRRDPLFTSALQVVRETLSLYERFEWDLKPLFHVEMAYLLLWAAIERYASLRYHLGIDATAKVMEIASEPAFKSALSTLPKPPLDVTMEVFRVDDPQARYRLKPDNPRESLSFYYQIRNNATHRGKAVAKDFDLVKTAANQLLQVFEQVLNTAFSDAEI